jgi:hypothetical protein
LLIPTRKLESVIGYFTSFITQIPPLTGFRSLGERKMESATPLLESSGPVQQRGVAPMLKRQSSRSSGVNVFSFAIALLLFPPIAGATITQGDFSIFGNAKSRWDGRFGEGSVRNLALSTGPQASARNGGSFTFDRWDLVGARQEIDLRPDYHFIKNYNFLGRLDTVFIKEADFFAIYRAWYDAFGDFKPKGVGQAASDFSAYTQREKQAKFMRNDLREYYAQIDVNDSLSFRVGKQQIIWTEADALSGTEIINPPDLRYHFIHFETPEDQRVGVEMLKMNYVFGDIWRTANNELEMFWVPGFVPVTAGGTTLRANTSSPRDPYAITYSNTARTSDGTRISNLGNQFGTLKGGGTFHDGIGNWASVGSLSPVSQGQPLFLDFTVNSRFTPSGGNMLDKSEFGMRYSSLLPIGNGLQVSLIYMWMYRAEHANIDPHGPIPPCIADGTCVEAIGPNPGCVGPLCPILPGTAVTTLPGIYGTVNTTGCFKSFQESPGAVPIISTLNPACPPALPGRVGVLYVDVLDKTRRAHYFGLSGTYYDKDLTDIVFRYDFSYRPTVGYTRATPLMTLDVSPTSHVGSWTDEMIGIIAFDRPTFIPWISKQHTFFVAQMTTNWYISSHQHDIPTIVNPRGKLRQFQNYAFVAAANWLWDGRLVSTNVFLWDIDTRAGFFGSNNVFRYSRNVILGLNLQWYLGATNRLTDPITMSVDHRINEVEFRFTYEI